MAAWTRPGVVVKYFMAKVTSFETLEASSPGFPLFPFTLLDASSSREKQELAAPLTVFVRPTLHAAFALKYASSSSIGRVSWRHSGILVSLSATPSILSIAHCKFEISFNFLFRTLFSAFSVSEMSIRHHQRKSGRYLFLDACNSNKSL